MASLGSVWLLVHVLARSGCQERRLTCTRRHGVLRKEALFWQISLSVLPVAVVSRGGLEQPSPQILPKRGGGGTLVVDHDWLADGTLDWSHVLGCRDGIFIE